TRTNDFFSAPARRGLTSTVATIQLRRASEYGLFALKESRDKVKRSIYFAGVESEEFTFSKALIGDPIDADAELEDVFRSIESNPRSFPSRLVEHPDVWMRIKKGEQNSIAVFY